MDKQFSDPAQKGDDLKSFQFWFSMLDTTFRKRLGEERFKAFEERHMSLRDRIREHQLRIRDQEDLEFAAVSELYKSLYGQRKQ